MFKKKTCNIYMYVIPFLKTELLFKFQFIFSFTPNILVKACLIYGNKSYNSKSKELKDDSVKLWFKRAQWF